MAWNLSGIGITVEVAFTTDPLATPTWTDVSDYVQEIPFIFRGKTSEDSDIGPSSATVIFANRDRRFDPDYASSPYSPNVKPMRRIRIRATYSFLTFDVFTGFVTSWRNVWALDREGRNENVSIATCVDSTWWASAEPLAATAHAQAVLDLTPALYLPMQDTSVIEDLSPSNVVVAQVDRPSFGQVTTTDIGYPLGAPLALGTTDPDNAGAVSADLTASQATRIRSVSVWFEGDGIATLSYRAGARDGFLVYLNPTEIRVDYSHDTDNRSLTTFGGQAIGVTYTTSEPHHLCLTCDTSNLYAYLDGTLAATVALTGADAALSGGDNRVNVGFTDSLFVSHYAVFAGTLNATEVEDLYLSGLHAYGHPVGETSGVRIDRALSDAGVSLRDIDTGISIQGPYLPAGRSAIDYIRDVVASERGLLFVDVEGRLAFRDREALTDGSLDAGVVLSDDGGTGAVTYEELVVEGVSADTIRNIVTVSYSDVGAITRRDSASVDEYGAQRLFIDAPTLVLGRDASNLAAFELQQRKDPTTRVTSVRCGLRQATSTQTGNNVSGLLGREIGDIVDVEITPLGVGSQVVKTVQVLGIEHVIGLEQWYVRLYLSPAYTQTGWFTLGTSALGGSDVLLP